MLQVGMGDASLGKAFGHAQPDLAQAVQHGRLVEVVADELVEKGTFDPLHLQDGIPLAADADALRQVAEVDREGQLGLARCLLISR